MATSTPLIYEDVVDAIEHFRGTGVMDPGVHRIRAHLGRGSVTTISKFKSLWLEHRKEQVLPSPSKQAPDPISALANRLWDEMASALDALDIERQNEAAAAISEANTQAEALRKGRDALQKDVEARRSTIASMEDKLAKQKLQLEARDSAIAEGTRQLEAAKLAQAALEKEHEKEIKTLRDHQEELAAEQDRRYQDLQTHKQEQADEHRKERQRLLDKITELEAKVIALQNQTIGQANHHKEMLAKQTREAREATDKLAREKSALEWSLQEATEAAEKHQRECAQAAQAASDALEQAQILRDERDASRLQLELLTHALLERDKQIEALRKQMLANKTDKPAAKD